MFLHGRKAFSLSSHMDANQQGILLIKMDGQPFSVFVALYLDVAQRYRNGKYRNEHPDKNYIAYHAQEIAEGDEVSGGELKDRSVR